jgi:DNA helicase-2/ATP-dependent DNA helicase PcrA
MDLATILQDLNPAQQAAVTSASPVVQILAPPGSGKTKTLTSRVAYHLRYHGYQPANTICLTFTIKSAREMKERIARLIGDGLERRLVLGTFHSVCRRYLVTYGHLIGVKKGFGIADSADSLAVIKRIVKRLKATLQPNVVRSRISRSKARREGYEDLRREATAKKSLAAQQEFLQIFQEYEAYLATSNLLDYDDLLLRCVDLLQKHPECVSNVEAVLIDEFQDTNSVQFELMRLFAARHQRITTVGDPDQSIYGWRSAEIKNLTKMQRLYADTLVLNLEVNYRSSEAI